jgi:biopolymer transport protein ExbD
MALTSGYEETRARIEMLPLIDIVFLLLVFFIYAMLSMVVHRGIKVQLPRAGTTSTDQRDYVNITISADNQLYVNDREVSIDEVAARVRAERRKPDDPVFINGDRRSDFGVAVRILDRLRAAGITTVSFECREAK